MGYSVINVENVEGAGRAVRFVRRALGVEAVRRNRSTFRRGWKVTSSLRRARSRLLAVVAFTLLGVAVFGAGADAKSPSPTTLKRCGYAKFTYGRSGVYPWHISCSAAQAVVVGSANPHARMIDFGPGWDGGAISIGGHYWVCTGQMGDYNCGYPYRPVKVNGEQGYKGPFTKDVAYETCAVVDPQGSKCPNTIEFTQP